jgi:hypothetical protein
VAFERPDRRGRSSSGARLVEDVLDVVACRLHRDPEGLGDLLVALAVRKREQDLELAFGQPAGQLAWPLHHPVASRSEHGVDRFRAETALLRVAQQPGLGVVASSSARCGRRSRIAW